MTTDELTPRNKQEVSGEEQTRAGRFYVPDVDIAEDGDGLSLFVDMPGVEQDAVSVEMHDDVLTIQGDVSLAPYEGLTPVYRRPRSSQSIPVVG